MVFALKERKIERGKAIHEPLFQYWTAFFSLRHVIMPRRYKGEGILAHRGALKARSRTGDP